MASRGSHRIDEEEFCSRYGFEAFASAAAQFAAWERIYNEQRIDVSSRSLARPERAAAPPQESESHALKWKRRRMLL